ncbi:hypothetical protein ScalyP_jg7379 [Parmales sp. scaly parma]|nr:hypothetical protein ScalyP_jg7379 [Parmales sp. scaly parma]|tara:strand:+ start:230 stop:565 length:336 start_codon:yes stop_codon:yes gene_type:complete
MNTPLWNKLLLIWLLINYADAWGANKRRKNGKGEVWKVLAKAIGLFAFVFFFFLYFFKFCSWLSNFRAAQRANELIWTYGGKPMVEYVKKNRAAREQNERDSKELRAKKIK